MSERGTCRWCGAAADIKDGMIFGQCGTWQVLSNGVVYRNSLCERDALRKRIDAAIIRAERATVFGLTIEGDVLCVFARDLTDVVKILTGNSPANPESSP